MYILSLRASINPIKSAYVNTYDVIKTIWPYCSLEVAAAPPTSVLKYDS